MKAILIALVLSALFVSTFATCGGTYNSCKDNDNAKGECCVYCGVGATNGTCQYQTALGQSYTTCQTTVALAGCPSGTVLTSCFCNTGDAYTFAPSVLLVLASVAIMFFAF